MIGGRAKSAATAIAALLLVTGCGGKNVLRTFAEEAGALGGTAARDAERLPDGTLRPRSAPSIVIPRSQATRAPSLVEQRTLQLLEPHAKGLSKDELIEMVGAACDAKDLYDLGTATSLEEATNQAWENYGGNGAAPQRLKSLAKDLSDADSSGDFVSQLAVYSICEAAA